MPGIPKNYKHWTRGYINFYGTSASPSFDTLKEALGNRGYVVERIGIDRGVTENLPFGLKSDAPYTVVRTVVYVNSERVSNHGKQWEPLVKLSMINQWDVAHKNSGRIQTTRRTRDIKKV